MATQKKLDAFELVNTPARGEHTCIVWIGDAQPRTKYNPDTETREPVYLDVVDKNGNPIQDKSYEIRFNDIVDETYFTTTFSSKQYTYFLRGLAFEHTEFEGVKQSKYPAVLAKLPVPIYVSKDEKFGWQFSARKPKNTEA